MRERAAELGGWCSVESTPGGTVVRAWLPDDVLSAPAGVQPAPTLQPQEVGRP